MIISGVSANTNYQQTSDAQNNFKQIQNDFQKLGQALQSGNLQSAQQIFSDLQQLLPGSAGTQATSGQQSSSQNTLSDDMNTLAQSLNSGDLSKAQDAFAKIQQDMQAAHKGHHHHHRKADDAQNSVSTANDVSSGNTQSDANVNVIV